MGSKYNRREQRLADMNVFRRNAVKLIEEMVFWSADTEEDTTPLVDEILHSIFFLGRFYKPPISPETIVTDEEMRELLKDSYPEAFQLYSSQLPRRAPFSCVLDMIVHKAGQAKEREIKTQLHQLVSKLNSATSKILLSTTMCVSQIRCPDSKRYYGVSLSTSGPVPGKVMVAASCLQTWHEHVAGAVLSYDLCKKPRQCFNGTIRLPENIRCEAYNISDQTAKPICTSCGNLFGFNSDKIKTWPYGSCAEVESVSKLLKNEAEVTKQVRFQAQWTSEGRQMAEMQVREELNQLLKISEYQWDGQFFLPQGIQPMDENDIEIN